MCPIERQIIDKLTHATTQQKITWERKELKAHMSTYTFTYKVFGGILIHNEASGEQLLRIIRGPKVIWEKINYDNQEIDALVYAIINSLLDIDKELESLLSIL